MLINKLLGKNILLEFYVKKYFKQLSYINNLNSGGCLYASYAVFLKLKKDGFDVSNISILQLSSWSEDDIEANKSFLKGNSQEVVSSSHFALSIGKPNNTYDSNGKVDIDNYNYYLSISSTQIERFSNNALEFGSWNKMFDRNIEVPKINKMFNLNLKI